MTTSGDWTQIFGILFFGNFIFWDDYLAELGYKPVNLPLPELLIDQKKIKTILTPGVASLTE